MHLSGNTILVTGGTSGIGRALAGRLHARGNEVIVAGRRQDLLDEFVEVCPGMHGIRVDVADPHDLRSFAEEVAGRFPRLNVLVNNAGISRTQDLAAGVADLPTTRSIVETNIMSVVTLTAELLPVLTRNADPVIMATTSGLAFVPRASFPTYCASKAFLHSWLQSLRSQLRPAGVEVVELVPPYVRTELAGPAQSVDPAAMPLAEYADEVMSILERDGAVDGEVLVERVKALRMAERDGTYRAIYAGLNGET